MYTPGKRGEAWLGEIKHTTVSARYNATRVLIAAVAGKRLVVVAASIICSGLVAGTMDAVFKSGTTALSGTIQIANAEQIGLEFNPAGWLVTAAGEALNVTLGNDTSGHLSGWLRYVEA